MHSGLETGGCPAERHHLDQFPWTSLCFPEVFCNFIAHNISVYRRGSELEYEAVSDFSIRERG